jgi:hypothetical protein
VSKLDFNTKEEKTLVMEVILQHLQMLLRLLQLLLLSCYCCCYCYFFVITTIEVMAQRCYGTTASV